MIRPDVPEGVRGGHEAGRRRVPRAPALRVPPDRAARAPRIHDHEGVRALPHDVAVRVDVRLAGRRVDGEPVSDDERGGARAGRRDLGVQVGVLAGHRGRPAGGVTGHAGRRAGPGVAEPVDSAPQPVGLAGFAVGGAVGVDVRPARRGDPRVAVEGGEGGQRAVEAVVGAAGNAGTAVVDQLAVGVGGRVGERRVARAGVERLLEVPLVPRTLDWREVGGAEASGGVQRRYARRQPGRVLRA
jgi:hypothetical protein